MAQAVFDRMTPAFVYDPTLVLYLPLRQLDSASFADRSAYGHLCTRYHPTWQLQGHYFDGTDDYLSIANHTALTPASITISLWIRPTVSGGTSRAIIEKRSGNDGFYIWHNAQHFLFEHNGNAGGDLITTPNHFTVGDWIYLVIVNNQVSKSIYENGLATVTGASTAIVTNTVAARIGQRTFGAGGSWLIGEIDDVRIYSRALNPMEIQRIYLETRGQYA